MECRRCGLRCFQPGSLWVHHTCVPAIAPRPSRRLALRPTARAPVLSPWTLVLAPRWCTVCLCFRTTVAATTYECVRTVHSPCSPISALPTWIFDLFFFSDFFSCSKHGGGEARPLHQLGLYGTTLYSVSEDRERRHTQRTKHESTEVSRRDVRVQHFTGLLYCTLLRTTERCTSMCTDPCSCCRVESVQT